MIISFNGNYNFLSNFFPAPVTLDGKVYRTVENAYQAAKTLNMKEREALFLCCGPSIAKQRGRRLTLRSDWEDAKLSIMEALLRQKFSVEPNKERLLATGHQRLIEFNTWGDTFWGVCNGVGENHLGKLLMKIREELR